MLPNLSTALKFTDTLSQPPFALQSQSLIEDSKLGPHMPIIVAFITASSLSQHHHVPNSLKQDVPLPFRSVQFQTLNHRTYHTNVLFGLRYEKPRNPATKPPCAHWSSSLSNHACVTRTPHFVKVVHTPVYLDDFINDIIVILSASTPKLEIKEERI